jgi:hypothetical protein
LPQNPEIGDAYLVNETATYNYGPNKSKSINAFTGDLLIATGTEGTDGKITEETLVWTLVPSGQEIDTTYKLSTSGKTLKLTPSTGSNNVDTIQFKNGTNIEIEGGTNSFTFKHAEITTTPATSSDKVEHNGTFTAITALDIDDDETGHVTGYTTTTYTLPN